MDTAKGLENGFGYLQMMGVIGKFIAQIGSFEAHLIGFQMNLELKLRFKR